jgi:hypothetical protein
MSLARRGDGPNSICIHGSVGKVPVLDLYRQMAIRQQKLQDYARALWWAERGLAIYANDADAVSDLRPHIARYQEKRRL